MCGVFGVINYSNLNKSKFHESIQLLNHRGPDSLKDKIFTKVALGFTRLAIQDLSSAGDQPCCICRANLSANLVQSKKRPINME